MPLRRSRIPFLLAGAIAALPAGAQLQSVTLPQNTSGSSAIAFTAGGTVKQGQLVSYANGNMECVSLVNTTSATTPTLGQSANWSCWPYTLQTTAPTQVLTDTSTLLANDAFVQGVMGLEVTARNNAIVAAAAGYIGKVDGKGPGGPGTQAITVSAFDTGAVVGPGAGSSTWASVAENSCGATCDTVNSYKAYWFPTASSSIQVTYCNSDLATLAAAPYYGEQPGPDMIITAGFEYPLDSGIIRPFFFQGGQLTGHLSPGGCLYSDVMQFDTNLLPQANGGQVAYIRTHAQRTPAATAVAFPGQQTFGYISGSSALTPYTTTKTGNAFDGFEMAATYNAAATTGQQTGLTATCSASSTALTFGANLNGTTSGRYNLYAGATVVIPGAGASGATLTTTITAMTGQAAATLATACTTAVSGAAVTLTPADKSLSGTIYNAQGGFASFAPFAVLARPTGTVYSVGFVGDSITYGQGANPCQGSWAVMAVNYTAAVNNLCTQVATLLPYVNASQSGDTAFLLSRPTSHSNRFQLLSRTKHIMGLLEANDFNAGETLSVMQSSIILVWQDEVQRGSVPHYGTVLPRVLGITNGAGTQSIGSTANETNRENFNSWYRDGAPFDCSTGAAAAVGSTSATVIRVKFINLSGIGTASKTAAAANINFTGNCAHPMGSGDLFELADYVEGTSGNVQTENAGYWLTNTDGSTTPLNATDGSYTVDGTHPSYYGHRILAGAAYNEEVINWTF